MTKSEDLNSVAVEKNKTVLCNAITACMIQNEMTMENLDDAYDMVAELYRTDAVIEKSCQK